MIFQFNLFGSGGLDPTQLDAVSIYGLIIRIINLLLGIIGAVAIVYIIMAGIQYITAAGETSKQAEAKKTIQTAILGLIIAVSSFAITNEVLRRLQIRDTIEQDINQRVRNSNPNQPNIIK